MAKRQEEDEDGARKYVTLDPLTLARLEKLAAGGWFGPTVPRVMRTLIENGIRDAREKRYLREDD